MITKVNAVAGPGDPRQDATSTEDEIARRLGEAQAQALALPSVPSLGETERRDAAAAGFAEPSGSGPSGTGPSGTSPSGAEAGLAGQAETVAELDRADGAADKAVEQAADLAASTISIPSVGDNEVFQVVREYLSGLIEGSRLTDVFAGWLKLPGAHAPPSADTVVTPNPAKLEAAAAAILSQVTTAQGMDDPVTDPNSSDMAYGSAQGEDPIDAAVDIVNDAGTRRTRRARATSASHRDCPTSARRGRNSTRHHPAGSPATTSRARSPWSTSPSRREGAVVPAGGVWAGRAESRFVRDK